MKKLLVIAATAAATLFTGCTPDAEQINKAASAIGVAAGLVANQTNIDPIARNTAIDILGEVRTYIPSGDQTFVNTWTPIIDAKIAELVRAGKITASVGILVKPAALMAAQAIDYTFDRYPKAKKDEELVRAGATGVIDGFLTVFKPANCDEKDDCSDCTVRASAKASYDKKAYEYFQEKFK